MFPLCPTTAALLQLSEYRPISRTKQFTNLHHSTNSYSGGGGTGDVMIYFEELFNQKLSRALEVLGVVIYVYLSLYIYIHINTNTHTYTCICAHAHMQICIYVCMYVCMYRNIHTRTHTTRLQRCGKLRLKCSGIPAQDFVFC